MFKLYNPLEQFIICNYINIYNIIDISINKLTIYLIFTLIIIWFLYFINYYKYIIYKLMNLLLNQFSFNYVISNNIILLISLFFFILTINLLGLIPYSYSITSQLIFTFIISFIILFTIMILSILNHKFKFIYIFIPKGIPIILSPFIFIIEFFTYIVRFFSLPIRLSANIIAGHILLSIFTGFIIYLNYPIISTPIIIILYIFEIGVAFIQSYVFILLISFYFKNIWYLH